VTARAARLKRGLERADLLRVHGRVVRSVGAMIEASGPPSFVGEICHVEIGRHEPPALAEVVGFSEGPVRLVAPVSTRCTASHRRRRCPPGFARWMRS